jgi:hypothetical protein
MSSVFDDYVRGWAAIAFTLTDFAAILILASSPRRVRIFAMGLATAGVLGYVFAPNVLAIADPWKWAFAGPVSFAIAAGLSGSFGARHSWLRVAVFIAFGALNLLLGFRSLGGVSLLVAGYLVFGAIASGRHTAFRRAQTWAAAGLLLFAVTVVGVLQLYDVAASQGLLGGQSQAIYEAQSGSLGVLVGGRSEVLVSFQAVIDSPILGHGSVAKDFAYVDLLTERRYALGYEGGSLPSDIGLIPAHSYLMGSWVWAGFLGGMFWLAVAIMAFRLVATLLPIRLEIAPILVFSTISLLWSIAFSPYAGDARIGASYGIALCLYGLRQVRIARAAEAHAGANGYPR